MVLTRVIGINPAKVNSCFCLALDSSFSLTGNQAVADLQNLAATATGYYDNGAQMHANGGTAYGQHAHNSHNGYYNPHQQSSYAPVYYPVGHGTEVGQHAAYDPRKRGYEALNDFFGDAKRRQIDPHSYPQVGQRLIALHDVAIHAGQMPFDASASTMVSVGGGGGNTQLSQSHYGLPMPLNNLRTKNDLINMDHFLDQVQSTVYESSNAAAAAGIHVPGSHYTHQNINFRQSQSPPHSAGGLVGQNITSTAPTIANTATHSPQSATPSLTPPSASLSYTSGNSPASVPGLSPSSRHNSAASANYPILPVVSSGGFNYSNTAPTSTLGTNFDNDPRRRFTGGMLQRSAGPQVHLPVDNNGNFPTSNPKDKANVDVSKPKVILSVSAGSSESDAEEAARDKAEELWVENIRVIEALRKFIADKLENGDYEEDSEDMSMTEVKDEAQNEPGVVPQVNQASLYPVLKATMDS